MNDQNKTQFVWSIFFSSFALFASKFDFFFILFRRFLMKFLIQFIFGHIQIHKLNTYIATYQLKFFLFDNVQYSYWNTFINHIACLFFVIVSSKHFFHQKFEQLHYEILWIVFQNLFILYNPTYDIIETSEMKF